MYHDLKKLIWWSGLKRDVAQFVYSCLICQKSKGETLQVRIEGREVKKLRGKEIPLVKVVWGGATGESLTWELESKMLESYPELFA